MAKVSFDPIIQWLTGTIGKLVYRRSHSGKTSVYESPDMTHVKWSQPQKDHRRNMSEAWQYASAAIRDPDIRPVYVRMAVEWGWDPKRPFHTAVSDYHHGGPDLLWKKHMGDQPKPENWNINHYAWYVNPKPRRPSKKHRRRW